MIGLDEKPPVPPPVSRDDEREDSPFPYVVWRTPGVYFTCTLELFNGPAGCHFWVSGSWVQLPEIEAGSRLVSAELRAAIEELAGQFVQSPHRFDYCIAWGPQDATYVSRDRVVTHGNTLPGSRIML